MDNRIRRLDGVDNTILAQLDILERNLTFVFYGLGIMSVVLFVFVILVIVLYTKEFNILSELKVKLIKYTYLIEFRFYFHKTVLIIEICTREIKCGDRSYGCLFCR